MDIKQKKIQKKFDQDRQTFDIYLLPNDVETKETLIWMHGLGDRPDSFYDFFLDQNISPVPATTKVILLGAPNQYVTCNKHSMNSWFDFKDFTKVSGDFNNAVSIEQIEKTGKNINKIIDQEVSEIGNSKKVYISGLSQGCAMAFYCGMQYPKTLGGIFGFSGFLPQNTVENEANKNTPVYISHGLSDTLIPWTESKIQYELRLDPKIRKVVYDLVPEFPHTMDFCQLPNWKKEFDIINNQVQ